MNKSAFILIAWYFLFVGFYISYFIGLEQRSLTNPLFYLFAIPYFGFGAMVWSVFSGVGIVTFLASVVSSVLWLKKYKIVYLFLLPIVGLLSGGIFRYIAT
ncbi:hypothetical protein N480_14330 [Pseudoalteromonas luteoviolacea S2607]|uniref:hypothetical protein n=1 Tax=Pseudoalteromonas luteoviolacea TaxID=43657 RepID=UPI0007B0499D|nr:hypothetical protein [Pseudoalteromonas luteoviolacea]KZN37917.1 hypothetical protein N480_14330 [Pseudoalteromonas luteoviolacea S2607]